MPVFYLIRALSKFMIVAETGIFMPYFANVNATVMTTDIIYFQTCDQKNYIKE
jgi:hypothetical protein